MSLQLSILGLLLLFETGVTFDCNEDCLGAYQLGEPPVSSCDVVLNALDCYDDNVNECSRSFLTRSTVQTVESDLRRLNCLSEPIAEENTSECPDLPDVEGSGPSMSMPSPHAVLSSSLPSACFAPASHLVSWNHCSLFMDSQLRAFSGYRQGLETCSIPGRWLLLDHPGLSIEVEGSNMTTIEGATYTRLSKINVTINPSECDPVSRSYIALGAKPLSDHLSPPVNQPKISSAIQLACDTNATVATLLVSWLSVAIVIRQYAGFLSVTIKVPSQVASESKGLCTGCPSEMYINITQVYDRISSNCSDARSRAEHGCFARGGVVNRDHLETVRNNTYLDVCLFNMYKTASIDVLTMISAVTDDAKAITQLPKIAMDPSTTSAQTLSLSSRTKEPTSNYFSRAKGLHLCSELAVFLLISLFLLLR